MNYFFWTVVVVACFILLLGVLLIFRGRQIITIVRDAWERGQIRTPDGQFKMIPTLAEARKFAGARGEPLVTCAPIVLDPDRDDPLDTPASSGSLLSHALPEAQRPRSRFAWLQR